jgi:hypothetical protein
MTFTAPLCTPAWAFPAELIALGLLLVLLGLVCRPRDQISDPHAEPFGDQPELPGDRFGRPS